MLNNFSRFKILVTIFILVLFDQVLKNAALAFLVMSRSANSLLSLEIYRNYGIAFGLPISAGVFYLAVFVFLISIFIGWKKGVFGGWREMDRGKIFAVGLIIAGALGNMIDRIRFGYIVDYINFGGMLIFNLADVFIVGGVLILLSGYFPHSTLIRKENKKIIYIILFVILGAILGFLIHSALEIWYINLLILDFSKYGLGLSWPQWQFIHSVGTVILFIVSLIFGYFQGKYWWKILYEK